MRLATNELGRDDLPAEFPVFPLSGALLLPGGRLPLNIFEPRYLAMTEAAFEGGRYLGMVQPKTAAGETVGDQAAIYGVGCLGRIVTFAEDDGGRFFITLQGLARFQIVRELDLENGYRRVVGDFSNFADDLTSGPIEGFSRQSFINALRAYFAIYEIKGSWETLDKADDRALITSVAMAVPFSPEEKQAVLECPALAEQGEMLQSLMEMAVHEAKQSPPPIHH